MSQQTMPFFESAEAATRQAIQNSGKSMKEVAAHIWKGKSVSAAQTHLLNCLNESREEKLSADEHIAIAEFCQEFDYLYYCAHRLSHTRPTLVTPEEHAAAIQAELMRKVDELQPLLSAFQRLRPKGAANG